MNAIQAAAQVCDVQGAKALLDLALEPGIVRALACRADELRVDDPSAALEIALAALDAQTRLPTARRRPRLLALTWWVFGSCSRARARFDEAEFALNRAASLVPRSDARGQVEVARRFADLRADQRREREARQLMAGVLAYWRRLGGRELGKRLCTSGAILIRFHDYRQAARALEESLTLLVPNGDRFHLSAIGNLAICRLELSSSLADLEAAKRLAAETARFVKPGTAQERRWRWLNGRLLQRLGRLGDSLEEMLTARAGIELRSNGYDRALFLLDLTDLHLERGEAAAARDVALSSFGVMAALRNEPEALRAMQALHRAAQALALDRATIRSVRRALIAARP